MTGTTALVIGGGIGGLAAAIALRQVGIEARVFERGHELERAQYGSGLFLWSNAIAALGRLGLAERVVAAGAPIYWFKEWTAGGDLLAVWPVGEMAREIGVPSVCIARSDLHPLMADALDDGVLTLDATCTGFAQDATGVTARFAGGREERGDLLIGADGIRSVVRGELLGPHQPRYAGYTAWRAIVPFAHARAAGDTFHETWGRGTRFIHYPVGRGRHYLSGFLALPEHAAEPAGGRRAMLLECFRDWPEPIVALIEAARDDDLHRTAIATHRPFRRWGEGRVTVLGDAAHPMTPNLGQGACQAIEDAVVLAACLADARASGDEISSALRTYEARRRGRTTSLMMRAWGIGMTGRMKHPLAVGLRDRISKVMFNTVALKQQRQDMVFPG